MKPVRLSLMLLLSLPLGLLVGSQNTPSGTSGAAKPFLPSDAYKELVTREAKKIQAVLGKEDFDTIQRGKVAALMIAVATHSARDGDPAKLHIVETAALSLATVLGEKDKADESRKLLQTILSQQGDASIAVKGAIFKNIVSSKLALMVMYMPKNKGGDGLHPDLQVSPRLKDGEEYIENLFSYLGKKALKPKQLEQAANELRLVGYRTAVSGELIDTYAPEKKTKKRDPEVWHKTSRAMIDSALDLAQAAQKRDAAGVQQAASRVTESCVQCHKMFQ